MLHSPERYCVPIFKSGGQIAIKIQPLRPESLRFTCRRILSFLNLNLACNCLTSCLKSYTIMACVFKVAKVTCHLYPQASITLSFLVTDLIICWVSSLESRPRCHRKTKTPTMSTAMTKEETSLSRALCQDRHSSRSKSEMNPPFRKPCCPQDSRCFF